MANPFDFTEALTDLQMEQMDKVRDAAKLLYDVLGSLPRTRSIAVAVTKLEECAMWANKGITHNE